MHIKSSKVEGPPQNVLMYDSGAQLTVVNNLDLLNNHKECRTPFLTANESIAMATRIGDLVLGGQSLTITLKGVLYSADIGYNLISTWAIANEGFEVSHDTKHLWVTSKETNKKFIIASSPGNNLFWGTSDLKPDEILPTPNFGERFKSKGSSWINAQLFAIVSNINVLEFPNPFGPKDLVYFHLVCGHASLEALRSMRKLKVLSFTENPGNLESLKACRVCNETNLTAKPHKKVHIPASRIHERVHSDTMGPILGDRNRQIYITTLIDEHTRYVELIVTDGKNFKTNLLDKLHVWNNRYPENPIRFFRSDNAAEMPTAEELEKLGIEKEPISSYSPQQNGLAEAVNKILISRIKKIIKPFEKKNYLHLLKLIFHHAAYLTNRLPPRNRDTLPQIAYHDGTVNEDSFMTFGMDVIVKISNHNEAKTAGIQMNKFNNTTYGIYVGHHGVAGIQVLLPNFQMLYTQDIKFCNTMNKIMEYFETAENMNLEKIHPEKDAVGQLDQCVEIRRHLRLNPIKPGLQTTVDHKDDIVALETAPLEAEVEDSYRTGSAVVPDHPNILTDIEVPDELDSNTETYTPLILPPDASADQDKASTDCRRTVGVDSDRAHGYNLTFIQDIGLMGLETSRAGANRNNWGVIPDSNQSVPSGISWSSPGSTYHVVSEGVPGDQEGGLRTMDGSLEGHNERNLEWESRSRSDGAGAGYGQMFPVHEDVLNTNHSSNDLNSLGSNEQGDGQDYGSVYTHNCGGKESGSHPEEVVQGGTPLVQGGLAETSGVPCESISTEITLQQRASHKGAENNVEYTRAYLGPRFDRVPDSSVGESREKKGEESREKQNREGEDVEASRPEYLTRSGRKVRMPMRFREVNSVVFDGLMKCINNIRIGNENFDAWKTAELKELQKWEDMGVYEWKKTPDKAIAIPTRWVYTFKEDDQKGAVYKARCVVQGFRQKEGIHYNKLRVLSPVAELLSIRLLTIIATEYDYPIHHLDIQSAYLHAPLPKGEEIHVRPPPGYDDREGFSWLLRKSVYGMKQAGYEWYQYLGKRLENMGLVPSDYEETTFTKHSKFGKLIVALYVDDLFLVAENEEVLAEFKKDLEKLFDLKYFGQVSEYLGIEFERTKEGYSLSQRKFLQKVLNDFSDKGITFRRSPVKVDYDGYGSNNNPETEEFYETPTDNTPRLTSSQKTLYESGVGSISWAANNTRPDLSFAANYLASKSKNPTEGDFKKLVHCLGYIKQTIDRKLTYRRENTDGVKGGLKVETFSDASFAPESDVKLVSGMVIYVNKNPVKWLSKKQKNITRSTAAAELVALSIAEDRTVHLVDYIRDLGFRIDTVKLYEDNQAVIACCQSKSISHTRKMVDIRMKIIRERLTKGYYVLEYVSSLLNIADMFTKALSPGIFEAMTGRLFFDEKQGEEVESRDSKLKVIDQYLAWKNR